MMKPTNHRVQPQAVWTRVRAQPEELAAGFAVHTSGEV